MKRGEQFKRIFTLLSQGKTAQDIIGMGFPESSVYWALNKYKKGEVPAEPEATEPWWMTAYQRMGLLHDCKDGRRGTVEENEILTDEGIIFEKVCNSCGEVIMTRFEKWAPGSDERYQQWKKFGYTGFDAIAQFRKLRSSMLK